MKYGITVDKDGTLKMNGKPFYAYGVNEYTMIFHVQTDPLFPPTPERIFPILKKYDIPVIRTPMMVSVETWNKYRRDPESAFEEMDHILTMCNENHIGLILSLYFNTGEIYKATGEAIWKLGDPNSEMLRLMKNFARDAVRRYIDNPALWGWEVSNEINLMSDMMNAYGEELPGQFTSAEGTAFLREIAKAIREVDDYRMISSGNAIQREGAYHLHQSAERTNVDHSWEMDFSLDTLDEYRQMLQYYSPDPINIICMHAATQNDAFRWVLKDKEFTYSEILDEYVAFAKSEHKGFYYGEFGDMGRIDLMETSDLIEDLFPKNLKAMITSGVQLATLWQFNGENNIFNDEKHMKIFLREIQKVNEQFKANGLQDITGIW